MISKKKCYNLKITYNPEQHILLTSANSQTELTLRLIKDIPVDLRGKIVVYL